VHGKKNPDVTLLMACLVLATGTTLDYYPEIQQTG